MVSVKDSVVFVTGANRENGIGRAIVEEAIKRGAKKVYATARDTAQLDKLVAKFQGKVVAVELEVTNPEQIKKVVEEAGDTQVLINNAGVSGFSGCCHNYNEQTARSEMEVNFFAPLHLMNAFSQTLIKNHKGAIVNIVSIGGLYPYPPAATYCASKAALFSLTRAVRIELAPYGVAVFGVYPGPIATGMAKEIKMNKESPGNVAKSIFDGMKKGVEEITPDAFAENFSGYLERSPRANKAIEQEFSN